MESRKLIRFGNNSHVITLPSSWIKTNKLKKGDSIYFSENGDNELIIGPRLKEIKSIIKDINIDISGKDNQLIQRQIISAYINGYNVISVTGKNLVKKTQIIHNIFHNLIALEVMEEDKSKIIANDLLNIKEVSINDIIRKLDLIIRSMMNDVKLMMDGEDNYYNILYRYIQVNRLSFLLMKIKKVALDNPSIAKEIGLIVSDIPKNWEIVYNIKIIGYKLKYMAEIFLDVDKKVFDKIRKVYEDVEELYLDTMKSYYKIDPKLAYNISTKKQEIFNECDRLYDRDWKIKGLVKSTENIKEITRNMHNIGRNVYS